MATYNIRKTGPALSVELAASAAHIVNTSNPHGVTKSQVGLGNVDNTSDASKPVSTAVQTALNEKQDTVSDLATIRTNAGKVPDIEAKIPSAASSSNQLADKAFVNSSIETSTATFRGTHDCTGSGYVALNRATLSSYLSDTMELLPAQKWHFWGNYEFKTGYLATVDYEVDETVEEVAFTAYKEDGTAVASGALDTMDSEYQFTYTGPDGDEEHWRVRFDSTNQYLYLERLISEVNDETYNAIANAFDAASLGYGTPDKNDYCFVAHTSGNDRLYTRYKYGTTTESETVWFYEYDVNTSGFTAAQWAAINSGITAGMLPSGAGASNQLVTASQLAAASAYTLLVYGTTTFAQAETLYNAGKALAVDMTAAGLNGWLALIGKTSTTFTFAGMDASGYLQTATLTASGWNKAAAMLDNIYFATYGASTFAEVKAAFDAGKACFCFYNNQLYTLYQYDSGYNIIQFSTGTSWIRTITVWGSDSHWSISGFGLEQQSNKVTSLSSASTDTQYPSAKCVYDRMGGKTISVVSELPASPDADTIYFVTE